MKLKTEKGFVGLAAGTFALSLTAGALAFSAFQPAPFSNVEYGAHAAWVSQAETVAEQVFEADLVARVQAVDRAEARHLWHPMPEGVQKVDGRGTFAFTDTQVEVLEVYQGKAEVGDRLWVMQTGADLRTHEGKTARLEAAEDPLYERGDEMVLFLIDISGDSVHAPNRELFRTVNPAGRYLVEGGLVGRIAPHEHAKAQILDLGALEDEIRVAVAERAALER